MKQEDFKPKHIEGFFRRENNSAQNDSDLELPGITNSTLNVLDSSPQPSL
jgi:hypothetical protein